MAQNDNKIIQFEDARKAAQAINQESQERIVQKQSAFEKLMNEIQKINPGLGGFDELAMMLALPEEQFALLAPIFLDELEKSYNNVQDKVFIAQAVNAAGQKMEDIELMFRQLINSIDVQFAEVISAQKRDFLKRMLSISYNSLAETEGVIKRIVQVPIELTSENAKIPKYAHLGDGAVDLYSPADYTIDPGETVIIPCDIKVALPYGYAFLIHPRSGTSAKTKLRIANSVGLVDSQYKGVIGVIVENIEPPIKDITYEFNDDGHPILTSVLHGKSYTISKGERFAQMRLVEVPTANFFQVESVDGIGDDRGGGFGSSGKN